MKSNVTLRVFAMLLAVALIGSGTAFSADYDFTYGTTKYRLVTEQLTWVDAAIAASEAGGKLAEVNSKEENTAIMNALKDDSGMDLEYIAVNDGGGAAYVWLGGTDRYNEGTWQWDGTGSGNGTDFWKGQGGAGDDDGKSADDAFQNWGASNCGTTASGTCEPDDFFSDQDGLGLCVDPNGWPYGNQGNWNDIDATNRLYYIIEFPAVELPAAPTDLEVTANNYEAQIDLTWYDNSDDEEGFHIYRTDGTEEVMFTVGANKTSFSDVTAKNGVLYTYVVAAFKDVFDSDSTSEVNGILNIEMDSPSSVKVSLDNAPVNTVITWLDNSDIEDYYRVYRKNTRNGDIETFDVPGNTTEFTDNTVINKTIYKYSVTAGINAVESAPSEAVEFEVNAGTAAPTNLAYERTVYNEIYLTWEDNCSMEYKYVITRTLGEEIDIFETSANAESFIDNTGDPNLVYAYYVQAVRSYTVNEETGTPAQADIYSAESNTVVSGDINIIIQGHSDELIECEGMEDLEIVCTAVTDVGVKPSYQWYKDGQLMEGETEHIFSFGPFHYTMSGVYKCKVYYTLGSGKNTYTVENWTDNISVYCLTEPEIMEHPKEQTNAQLGQDYTFSVKVHYRGLIPPLYKDDFQWYRVDGNNDTTLVLDSERIAGANSSRMTINNLQNDDINEKGGYYFVKVIGLCGTVYSEPFTIAKSADVVFEVHPTDILICKGRDTEFSAKAVAQGYDNLVYQWKKDGADIEDGFKFNGTDTRTLQVFDVQEDDEAAYTCEATIDGQAIEATSKPAMLELKEYPLMNAVTETEVEVVRETDVHFELEYVEGTEPMTVTWLYNDVVLSEDDWSIYDSELLLQLSLDSVTVEESGEYVCRLENECAKHEVVFKLNVTKWDATGIEDNNPFFTLYDAAPNPVTGDMATVKFHTQNSGKAVINLYDANGNRVATLFDKVAPAGMNVITVNLSKFNLTSGAYFYSLETENGSAQGKLIINK